MCYRDLINKGLNSTLVLSPPKKPSFWHWFSLLGFFLLLVWLFFLNLNSLVFEFFLLMCVHGGGADFFFNFFLSVKCPVWWKSWTTSKISFILLFFTQTPPHNHVKLIMKLRIFFSRNSIEVILVLMVVLKICWLYPLAGGGVLTPPPKKIGSWIWLKAASSVDTPLNYSEVHSEPEC